jgi:hypothetical protein
MDAARRCGDFQRQGRGLYRLQGGGVRQVGMAGDVAGRVVHSRLRHGDGVRR